MNEGIISPLMVGDLEGAAYLCLAAAAMTDLDQISGDLYRREHHERKHRFERAQELMKNGSTSLSELGLSADDCGWAASKASLAKDKEGWLSRFQTAENQLRKSH